MATPKTIVGFANLDDNNPYAAHLRDRLMEAADRNPNMDLIVRDNAMDSARAKANIQEFLSVPVDVAIMFHIDQRASMNLVFPLRLKQIPVLAVDIPIGGAYYFGFNNLEAGQLAGQALVDWLKTHWNGQVDKVCCMTEDRVLEFTHQRFDCVIDALRRNIAFDPKHDLLHMANGSNADQSRERFANLLAHWQDDHIVVVCINDSTAQGVIRAVRDMQRTSDIAIVSYDGTQVAMDAFASSDINMVTSPYISQDQIGEQILDLCAQLAAGERIAANTNLPTYPLDTTNYHLRYGGHKTASS